MTPDLIDDYAQKIYAQNVERGWWDDPDRDIYQTLQLVNTEIAEATEGDRKNRQDDHLPHRSMVEVELADTLIRLLDLAGRYGWTMGWTDDVSDRLSEANNLAAKHLWLTEAVCRLARDCSYSDGDYSRCSYRYNLAVNTLLRIAKDEGYDLRGAVDEKLAYNKTRADHSREARAETGGKAY